MSEIEKYRDSDEKQHRISKKIIVHMSDWMDTKFRIPGTKITFGLDPLLSLVPWLGDTVSTGISLGIFGMILAKGVPLGTAFKMLGNILLDTILSAIPILGTVFDIGYKSNSRNLKMLERHLEQNPEGKYYAGLWWVFIMGVFLVLALLGLLFYGIYQLLENIW